VRPWIRSQLKPAVWVACAALACTPIWGETIALSVSPPLIEESLAAGGDRTFRVTLTNDGDRTLRAKAEMADLVLNVSGEPVPREPGSDPWSLAPWVRVDPAEVELRPGERRQVQCRIRAPRGAAGGRYGALLFTADREAPLAGSGLRFQTRTGVVFLVTIARTERRQAEVAALQARPAEGGVALEAVVRNTGNAHFRAQGEAVVKDTRDRVLARVRLEGGTGTVLPGGERRFAGRWEATRAEPGRYRLQVRFRAPGLRGVERETEFTLPEGEHGQVEPK
jgi:hypothetical protein